MAVAGSKESLRNIFFTNPQLVVMESHINLRNIAAP